MSTVQNEKIPETQNGKPLIRIEHLKKYFTVRGRGELHAVDDVAFDIMPKETVGLVGESGCGKSTVGNVIMKLLEATSGKIELEGWDMLTMSSREMHEIRREIQIIFQDPYSSLNPKKTIRAILEEPFRIHKTVPNGNLQ